jgi:uncharacterized membrane-anchored protein YhcB (DUF1043 family)
MTILLSVIALLVGAIVGWVIASARKTGAIQRALAERDLARAERERSEAVSVEARRLANLESQARVAAETQASFLGDARKQMEEAFAATAQKTLATISTSFLELNKAHLMDGLRKLCGGHHYSLFGRLIRSLEWINLPSTSPRAPST